VITLLFAVAHAGGGGAYVDLWSGTAISAATGFVTRGGHVSGSAGAYFGGYEGSFRFGPYWKIGGTLRVQQTETLGRLSDSFVVPGVEVVRGVDLLKLNAFGGAQLGFAVGYRRQTLGEVFDPGEDTPVTTQALAARVFGGVGYNLGHWFSVQVRVDWGIQLESRTANIRGIGTCLSFRVPVYRSKLPEEEGSETSR